MERVMGLMKKLVIADKHAVAGIIGPERGWKPGTSSVNNAYKILKDLVDLGRLEKGNGYFRIPGCKSEYCIHAQIGTKVIARIHIAYPDSIIYREHTIHEVGLRPDILCLLINGKEARCLWVEVKNLEDENYFQMKVNALKSWNALPYLSKLFGYAIPAYDLVKDTELEEL